MKSIRNIRRREENGKAKGKLKVVAAKRNPNQGKEVEKEEKESQDPERSLVKKIIIEEEIIEIETEMKEIAEIKIEIVSVIDPDLETGETRNIKREKRDHHRDHLEDALALEIERREEDLIVKKEEP